MTMFNSYYDDYYKVIPKYSPQVLIGNWYEDRFHYNRSQPVPDKVCSDGFRCYGTTSRTVIVPHKRMHPLDTTLRTSSAAEPRSIITSSESEIFKEKQQDLAKRKSSQERQYKDFNLLSRSKQTTYSRDYQNWRHAPRWMQEGSITYSDDKLGDITTRQNNTHSATYLPPIDAPRLVAM